MRVDVQVPTCVCNHVRASIRMFEMKKSIRSTHERTCLMLGRVLAGLVKEEAREHRLLLLRRERKTNPGSEIKMRVRSHNGGDNGAENRHKKKCGSLLRYGELNARFSYTRKIRTSRRQADRQTKERSYQNINILIKKIETLSQMRINRHRHRPNLPTVFFQLPIIIKTTTNLAWLAGFIRLYINLNNSFEQTQTDK